MTRTLRPRVKNGLSVFSALVIAGIFAALLAITADAVTLHAADDFESGDLSGGLGWADSAWTTTGSARVRHKEGPVQGSQHVRIRKDGTITRSVDLTGESQVFLSFWLKAKGFKDDTSASVIVTPDGGSPVTLNTWTEDEDEDDNTYRQYTYDLDAAGVTPATLLTLRFVINGEKNGEKIHVDDIQIYSTPLPPAPTPTATLSPTDTPTATPVPTDTPTPTATPFPTAIPSPVPGGEPTPTPVPSTLTPTPVPVPTNAPTPTPTSTPPPPLVPAVEPTPTNTPVPTPPPGIVTIDGSFGDWSGQAFISDPFNDQVGNEKYDLHEFYWANNLNEEVNYHMIKRQTRDGAPFDGTNGQDQDGQFILFIDGNNDGDFTGPSDRIVEIKHEPGNGGVVRLKVRLAEQPSVILNAGWSKWGETSGEGGLRLEFAVNWSDLGISLGDVIRMYVVSYSQNISNPNVTDRLPDSGDIQWSPASIFGPVLLGLITGFGILVVWWFRGRRIWNSG